MFSWTEREDFKVGLRNVITEQSGQPLSFTPILDWLDSNISNWERKRFEDFNYISVPPPLWALITNYVLVILASGGVIGYSVRNEYTEDNPAGSGYWIS